MRGTILCYGDSNTYGYDPRDFFGGRYAAEERWPERLGELLGCAVINEGENGRVIPHTERNIGEALERIERRMPLDLLIVMLGSNDMFTLDCPDPARVAARMERFLMKLRGRFPDLAILLLSPPRTRVPLADVQEGFLALPPLYMAAARRCGALFADAARWAEPIGADAVHLTPEANVALARGLKPLVTEILAERRDGSGADGRGDDRDGG